MTSIRIAAAASLALATAPLLASQPISLQPVTGGLSFPLDFVQDPNDTNVQLIVEQTGAIRVLESGVVSATDFADLSGVLGNTTGEQGLLGFAIDPANVDTCYVAYTDGASSVVIARFTRDLGDPLEVGDPTDLTPLLTLGQPFPNNNGGHIAFGPDGYLYASLGDGGAPSDFQLRGQDPKTLWATIIRADVSDTSATSLTPAPGNPFIGDINGNDLVWHFGVRNPWRFSWDTGSCSTGAMMVADLGQDTMDEVNAVPGDEGHNFGWSCKEGTIAFSGCAGDPGLTDPIHAYSGAAGQSVTGGFVYRGAPMPHNRGRFFFSDFVTGQIWSLELVDNGDGTYSAADHTEMLATGRNISSFGRDAAGDLYILDYLGGELLKLVPNDSSGDLNLSGNVDGADLGLLLSLWGATDCSIADLNYDGTVSGSDLGLLLSLWSP
ncbi:MAG: PQQ-dependent sugar dehydrogenase [Planctomycetota bacterium]|jgi:glucose/arabinose dehydrogenase